MTFFTAMFNLNEFMDIGFAVRGLVPRSDSQVMIALRSYV